MLLFQDKGLDWSYSWFFIKSSCRTGLEIGLTMMRTQPKSLWHLLLCGCHHPRVSGAVEGYSSAAPAGTEGCARRQGITQTSGEEDTTAWQVGTGRMSCFNGGTACPGGTGRKALLTSSLELCAGPATTGVDWLGP